MADEELSADDAWHTLRRYGGWHLLRDAFIRFRYGDAFSHSRALALQLCLAVVPFLIALTGLTSELGVAEGGLVVAETVVALTPGASDAVVTELLVDTERTEDAGELALLLGLLTGMVSLTTTMAQVERGANRIYESTSGLPFWRSVPAPRRWPGSSSLSAVVRWATRSGGTTTGGDRPRTSAGTSCAGRSASG
jgi:uncharacterized BrkB/YihY/UPF0761 family membrane protein